MTITNIYAPVRANGDGLQTAFTFNFKIFDESELVVKKVVNSTNVSTTQTIVTDYTVTINTASEGGTVNYVVAPTSLEDSLIERVLPITQTTDIPTVGTITETQLENEYDKSRMIDQQLVEQLDRTFSLSVEGATANPSVSYELPAPDAGKALLWNSGETALENSTVNLDDFQTDVTNTATNASNAATSATNAANSAAAAAASAAGLGGLTPSEQSTPDDTVLLQAGTYRSPLDYSKAITVALDVASAVTFPVVTSDSRIDLLLLDENGTASRQAGVQAASPVAPAYPADKIVVAEVTVDETVTVVINDADIRNVTPIIVGGLSEIDTLDQLLFYSDSEEGATDTINDEVTGSDSPTIGANSGLESSVSVSTNMGDYFRFDGTDGPTLDHDLDSTATVAPQKGFTLCSWIRINDSHSGNNNTEYARAMDSSNTLILSINSSGGATSTGYAVLAPGGTGSNQSLATDTWKFIAATLDSAGLVTVYEDGAEVETFTATIPAAADFDSIRYNNAETNLVDTFTDGVGFWNKVLKSSEISFLYNSGDGRTHGQLV